MNISFDELLNRRRSIRAFTQDPVDRKTIESVLKAARRAPSGANLQPGCFHVLTGRALIELADALTDAENDGRPYDEEYSYFPSPMPPELLQRQRAAGKALYEAMGVAHRDLAARREAFARNYSFFSAPVGLVVTIHRNMGKGCFMDLGMSMMALFLSAESHGLATTGIGALSNHGRIVHEFLSLPENELVVCGIALGYIDDTAPVNKTRTSRLDLSEFAKFYGFLGEAG